MKNNDERKRRWVKYAYYLDEPIFENEIKDAFKNELVRKDLFKLIQILQKNNT